MHHKRDEKVIHERLEGLHEKMQSTGKTIVHLKESFDRIEKLITIVRGITAKTDLLALNASIEAARAGHSGKGFAVVAHEVARLAEKSQESIQNVDAVFIELKEGIMAISEQAGKCASTVDELLSIVAHAPGEESISKSPKAA